MKSDKKIISSFTNISDKNSWLRKFDNMQKLVDEVNAYAEEITEIDKKMLPLFDDIAILRNTMVDECIHPIDQLVEHDDHVECKFCNKKFTVR
jgi:hypothetical protein